MSTARDMTQRQFDEACAKLGFVRHSGGLFGYYTLPSPKVNVSVSIRNAGKRRRDQLAYLIKQDRVQSEKYGRKDEQS
jgi:hypothetical protein